MEKEPLLLFDEYHLDDSSDGIAFTVRSRDYKGGMIVFVEYESQYGENHLPERRYHGQNR